MTVDPSRNFATLLVTFRVDPAHIEDLQNILVESSQHQLGRPGFVACTLHRSADNTTIVEYLQYETKEDLAVMQKATEGTHQMPPFPIEVDHTLLDVVDVLHAVQKP
ncbi:antibiotic biosynthesis monooxygenase [Mycobacterium deserti]|uniref:Antibiotic biosynthesis monooxygenase n=1 Tax=Mycobacterium deserti TaxID=2978347 RepID=A0ABT2MHZ3_9MYCO|nr:antibiotic biosynthesis monooxygenase [Mycobacterium deserti]MCT7660720.1 antibiotic biosynthesis monooxygenase [Mycobacterium deserti]